MKVKLGQQIEFKKSHYISLAKGGKAKIKVGDKAQVLRKINETTAEILYLTGEAKGLSQNIKLEVDDTLNTDSIVQKILKGL